MLRGLGRTLRDPKALAARRPLLCAVPGIFMLFVSRVAALGTHPFTCLLFALVFGNDRAVGGRPCSGSPGC